VISCYVVVRYQSFTSLHPEDEGRMDLWNFRTLPQHCTTFRLAESVASCKFLQWWDQRQEARESHHHYIMQWNMSKTKTGSLRVNYLYVKGYVRVYPKVSGLSR
jgi:hypothetical protein